MTDDFDKLQQQYHDATFDERNRLWPGFIRAIREKYPGFLEEVDDKFRNGDYLRAMLEGVHETCVRKAGHRRRQKSQRAGGRRRAMAVFDKFQQADSQWRETRGGAGDTHPIRWAARVASDSETKQRIGVKETRHRAGAGKGPPPRDKQKNDAGYHSPPCGDNEPICAEKGWSLDERGIADAVATEIKADPRYKDRKMVGLVFR